MDTRPLLQLANKTAELPVDPANKIQAKEIYDANKTLLEFYVEEFKKTNQSVDQRNIEKYKAKLSAIEQRIMYLYENKYQASIGYSDPENNTGLYYEETLCDNEAAIKWYQKAADTNSILGTLNLGRCYLDGRGVKKDLEKGFALYARIYPLVKKESDKNEVLKKIVHLSENGDLEIAYKANKFLAESYIEKYKQLDNAENKINVDKYIFKMAELGKKLNALPRQQLIYPNEIDKLLPLFNKNCPNNVGVYYTTVLKDEKQAVFWYKEAIKKNIPQGMENLGARYISGTGVNRDIAEAARLLIQSYALYVADDRKKIVESHLNTIAELTSKEDLESIYQANKFLAEIYAEKYQKTGNVEDAEKSEKYILKIATLAKDITDDKPANFQNDLIEVIKKLKAKSKQLEREVGIFAEQKLKDKSTAIKFYQAAVEKKDAIAALNLAKIYQNDNETLEKSIALYKKSYLFNDDVLHRNTIVQALEKIGDTENINIKVRYAAFKALAYIEPNQSLGRIVKLMKLASGMSISPADQLFLQMLSNTSNLSYQFYDKKPETLDKKQKTRYLLTRVLPSFENAKLLKKAVEQGSEEALMHFKWIAHANYPIWVSHLYDLVSEKSSLWYDEKLSISLKEMLKNAKYQIEPLLYLYGAEANRLQKNANINGVYPVNYLLAIEGLTRIKKDIPESNFILTFYVYLYRALAHFNLCEKDNKNSAVYLTKVIQDLNDAHGVIVKHERHFLNAEVTLSALFDMVNYIGENAELIKKYLTILVECFKREKNSPHRRHSILEHIQSLSYLLAKEKLSECHLIKHEEVASLDSLNAAIKVLDDTKNASQENKQRYSKLLVQRAKFCLEKDPNIEQAIEDYTNAISLDNVDAIYELPIVEQLRGDYDLAIIHYKSAMSFAVKDKKDQEYSALVKLLSSINELYELCDEKDSKRKDIENISRESIDIIMNDEKVSNQVKIKLVDRLSVIAYIKNDEYINSKIKAIHARIAEEQRVNQLQKKIHELSRKPDGLAEMVSLDHFTRDESIIKKGIDSWVENVTPKYIVGWYQIIPKLLRDKKSSLTLLLYAKEYLEKHLNDKALTQGLSPLWKLMAHYTELFNQYPEGVKESELLKFYASILNHPDIKNKTHASDRDAALRNLDCIRESNRFSLSARNIVSALWQRELARDCYENKNKNRLIELARENHLPSLFYLAKLHASEKDSLFTNNRAQALALYMRAYMLIVINPMLAKNRYQLDEKAIVSMRNEARDYMLSQNTTKNNYTGALVGLFKIASCIPSEIKDLFYNKDSDLDTCIASILSENHSSIKKTYLEGIKAELKISLSDASLVRVKDVLKNLKTEVIVDVATQATRVQPATATVIPAAAIEGQNSTYEDVALSVTASSPVSSSEPSVPVSSPVSSEPSAPPLEIIDEGCYESPGAAVEEGVPSPPSKEVKTSSPVFFKFEPPKPVDSDVPDKIKAKNNNAHKGRSRALVVA